MFRLDTPTTLLHYKIVGTAVETTGIEIQTIPTASQNMVDRKKQHKTNNRPIDPTLRPIHCDGARSQIPRPRLLRPTHPYLAYASECKYALTPFCGMLTCQHHATSSSITMFRFCSKKYMHVKLPTQIRHLDCVRIPNVRPVLVHRHYAGTLSTWFRRGITTSNARVVKARPTPVVTTSFVSGGYLSPASMRAMALFAALADYCLRYLAFSPPASTGSPTEYLTTKLPYSPKEALSIHSDVG